MLNTIISSQDNNGAETPLTQLPIVEAITEEAKLPELPNELIEGVIRRGSKLLVTGASKSGKSFLFIELALAVATGGKWCGTQCAKGRVLYVNLEIQEPQFMRRVYEVMEKPGMVGNSIPRNFHIANLRGKVLRHQIPCECHLRIARRADIRPHTHRPNIQGTVGVGEQRGCHHGLLQRT